MKIKYLIAGGKRKIKDLIAGGKRKIKDLIAGEKRGFHFYSLKHENLFICKWIINTYVKRKLSYFSRNI